MTWICLGITRGQGSFYQKHDQIEGYDKRRFGPKYTSRYLRCQTYTGSYKFLFPSQGITRRFYAIFDMRIIILSILFSDWNHQFIKFYADTKFSYKRLGPIKNRSSSQPPLYSSAYLLSPCHIIILYPLPPWGIPLNQSLRGFCVFVCA